MGFIDSVVTECVAKINKPSGGIVLCDLFSGSGKVANHFKDRFKVVANDLEYYSFATLSNLLNNDSSVAYECQPIVDWMNYAMEGDEGFIYKNYSEQAGRTYFTDENAMKIDAGISLVYDMYGRGELTDQQFYYCLCSVLEAADKVSNTTGLYTAYLKEFKASSIKPIYFKAFDLKDAVASNDVYMGDANDLVAQVSGDILYLDPPYNQRQYSGDYHLLNTIAQNDKPDIAGVTGKRVGRVGSPWSSKRLVEDEFRKLVESANFEFLVMSYSNESLMAPELVADIMSASGKYSVHEMKHKRFSSIKGQRNAEGGETVTEYLHVLHKASS